MDNVFIERLWRSLKCELIYLSSYDNLHELEAAITRWMNDYNHHRIHQTLGYSTPWENYRPAEGLATAACKAEKDNRKVAHMVPPLRRALGPILAAGPCG